MSRIIILVLLSLSSCAKHQETAVIPNGSPSFRSELNTVADNMLGHEQPDVNEYFGEPVQSWSVSSGIIYVYRGYETQELQEICKTSVKLRCTETSTHFPVYFLIENGVVVEFILGE